MKWRIKVDSRQIQTYPYRWVTNIDKLFIQNEGKKENPSKLKVLH